MNIAKILLPAVLPLFTASCANWNSIHRQSDLTATETQVISVDAKQRHLVSVYRPVFKPNGEIDPNKSQRIICAEPSPDVFSVYSAALEANAGKEEELQAALKLATGETGATIGLRTESIQLLRDAMYRLCEAYAADGIEKKDYASLLSKYQKSMVSLIAIAQVTGAVRPPQIVISNQAQLESSQKLYEAKTELAKAEGQLENYQSEQQSLVGKVAASEKELGDSYEKKCPNGAAVDVADKEKCEKHKTLLEQKLTKDSEIVVAAKNVQEWQKVLDGEQARVALGNTSSVSQFPVANAAVDSKTMIAVAKTVKEMANDVFMDDAVQTCLELVKQVPTEQGAFEAFAEGKKSRGIVIRDVLEVCSGLFKARVPASK